ncbi:MAG: hypothetical protein JF616_20330 [Fibrobacteres bacterium]|jgi:hypothetical protein|nr:hypothetical protein [Fibrobacterota bacterium]
MGQTKALERLMEMKRIYFLLLLNAVLAGAASVPMASRPSFLSLETPWQMTGQAGGGLGGALVLGWIGAGIGSHQAYRSCLENIDPDFSDECGWSAFGGAAIGFLIGAPIGHSLGALTVGLLENKHGAPVAAVSALVGDAAMVLLATGLHSALDGKILSNGKLDPFLIPITIAGMIAIPVATQSIWDYRVRIALQPAVALGATAGDNRYFLRFAEVRF